MRKFYCCLILVFCLQSIYAQTNLIVNEFSQGNQGSREFIELLVVGTRTCTDSTADLRNWIFDDHNGWYGGSGTGIAAGHFRFKDDPNWAAVPYGSIILIYNPDDRNTGIPAGANDPTDANDDYVYILPINSTFLEQNIIEPVSPSSTTYVYPTANYSATTDWVPVGLANGGDAVIIVNPANRATAHFSIQFGFVPATGAQTPTVNKGPVVAGSNCYLSDDLYTTAASWLVGIAGTAEETPGAPNTTANAAWIQSMRVQGGSSFSVTVSTTAPTCTVATGSITIDAPIGAAYTYSIDGVNFQNSPVFNGLTPGDYTVTVLETGGCRGTATLTIPPAPGAPSAPVATLTQPTCNQTTGSIDITAPVGTGLTYSIDGTNFQGTTTFSGLTPNTYTITVRTADGCTAAATVTINAAPATPAAPTVTSPVLYCVGDAATPLSATGSNLLWYTTATGGTGSATAPTPVTTITGNTSYFVSQTVAGCESNRTEIIVQVSNINLQPITGNTLICMNASMVSLLSNTTAGGTWTSSNTSVATVNNSGLVTAIAEGTTTIRYRVEQGSCADEVEVDVTVYNPEITLTASSLTVNPGGNVTLTASASTAFTVVNWLPESAFTDRTLTVQTIFPVSTTTYSVVGQNPAGCLDTASVQIEVIAGDEEIYIPNAFTPNGDGINDFFRVYGHQIRETEMLIFNQWGEKIYEAKNTINGWNGRHKGKLQPSGVYIYVVRITLNNGEVLNRKGSINLLR
ncbi:MAG TPA: gliding motility-associated C-terminal domain-containing protein [Ferruginibacter sp.]|nr:gliding motility-associated C-terminal domain-containing protein [Ferruginibacter sp.]HRO17653.1 gliding motility-associated C-terminal domain-containing protein [Ferruginibacter sp.]HRQ21564.1 gliding motility-associated C-terminal domain-containing protein [Ferruginibacter sp.]